MTYEDILYDNTDGIASIAGISGMGLHAVSMFYSTDESKKEGNAFKDKRKPDFRKYQK